MQQQNIICISLSIQRHTFKPHIVIKRLKIFQFVLVEFELRMYDNPLTLLVDNICNTYHIYTNDTVQTIS
jgi:hypothetical protein